MLRKNYSRVLDIFQESRMHIKILGVYKGDILGRADECWAPAEKVCVPPN